MATSADEIKSKLQRRNVSDKEIEEIMAHARQALKDLPDKLAEIEAMAGAKKDNKEISYDAPQQPAQSQNTPNSEAENKNAGRNNGKPKGKGSREGRNPAEGRNPTNKTKQNSKGKQANGVRAVRPRGRA